jgi:hypothetical protein
VPGRVCHHGPLRADHQGAGHRLEGLDERRACVASDD